MPKLEIKQNDIIEKMIISIEKIAQEKNVSLKGINLENWENFLDENLDTTGQIRCENFADIAWNYAIQFGEFGGDEFDKKRYSCIEKAVKKLEKKYS